MQFAGYFVEKQTKAGVGLCDYTVSVGELLSAINHCKPRSSGAVGKGTVGHHFCFVHNHIIFIIGTATGLQEMTKLIIGREFESVSLRPCCQ